MRSVLAQGAHVREMLAHAERAQARHALRMDLDKLFDELPDDLQVLWVRLQTSSVSEISRETGVPRGTVYERIHKLRSRFDQAGIAAYLGPTLSDGRR